MRGGRHQVHHCDLRSRYDRLQRSEQTLPPRFLQGIRKCRREYSTCTMPFRWGSILTIPRWRPHPVDWRRQGRLNHTTPPTTRCRTPLHRPARPSRRRHTDSPGRRCRRPPENSETQRHAALCDEDEATTRGAPLAIRTRHGAVSCAGATIRPTREHARAKRSTKRHMRVIASRALGARHPPPYSGTRSFANRSASRCFAHSA